MCYPMMIAAGVAMAMSAMQITEQTKQAKEYNKSQSETYKDTAEAANENARHQYYALALRQQQEAAKTSQAVQKQNREALAAQGTALAAAADSGTSGNSVDALIADYARSAGSAKDAALQNLEWTNMQLDEEKQGVYAQTKSVINQAKPQYAAVPGLLGSILKIGGAGASAYFGAGGGGGTGT